VPILLAPGNHDVHLEPIAPLKDVLLPPSIGVQQRPFRTFTSRLGTAVIQPDRYGASHVCIPKAGALDMIIAAFNSTRAECRDAQGMGWVGLDQIARRMRCVLRDPAAKEGSILVAALHHHVLPIGNVPIEVLRRPAAQRGVSFTLDSSEITNVLVRMGFAVLLHGHTHESFYRVVSGFECKEHSSPDLVIAGTGSFSLKHPIQKKHEFHLMSFRKLHGQERLLWELYRFTRAADTPNDEWSCEDRKMAYPDAGHWNRHRVSSLLHSNEMVARLRLIEAQVANLRQWSRLRILHTGDLIARQRLLASFQRLWAGKGLFLTRCAIEQILEVTFSAQPPTAEQMVSFDPGDYWKQVNR
jgi:hypothetical protein